MIIWANHNLRASVNAMQEVTRNIFENETLINIEKSVNNFSISIFQAQLRFLSLCHLNQKKKWHYLFFYLFKIVPVSEIFRLQNDQELIEAESMYLPKK